MAAELTTGSSTEMYLVVIIAVLLLVILAVLLKMRKQQRQLDKKAQQKTKIDQKQEKVLDSMSKDIYHLTQDLIESNEIKTNALGHAILNSANNMRELLKIKADKVEIYYETFSFSQMLDDITASMAPHFQEQETELIFQVDNNVPMSLTTDVVHLSRIINNILEFSTLLTPKGVVKLNAWTSGKDKSILNMEISDNGEGIESSVLDEIFNLTHDDETGEHVGLSLYIAKELSLQMGGRLEVKSKTGQGSSFFVAVPIEPSSEADFQVDSGFYKSLSNKKVLICMSRPATTSSLKMVLQSYYQNITLATRDEMDRTKVNLAEYDLLFLDENYFDTKHADYLSLIKDNKTLKIVATSSIFSNKEPAEFSCIDTHIKMPITRVKTRELVAFIEEKEEETEALPSSYVGALAVYQKPIAESKDVVPASFSDFSGARLLIVEDNLINQKILLGVLKDSGMEIDIANNGQEALDLLFVESKVYDIVLMDISMPVMDGEEATKAIRTSKRFDDLPIVTFTAFAMGEEIRRMFLAGVNAYLTKPLNIKKLYTVFSVFFTNIKREEVVKSKKNFEGLDIKSGIKWADENEILYKEMLKEFVDVYGNTVESVPKLIESMQYEHLKVMCREMQGILTFIGAHEMKTLIDEIQKELIYRNEEHLRTYAKKYPKVLTKLIDNINLYTKQK